MSKFGWIAGVCLALAGAAAVASPAAPTCSKQSPAHRVPLIELYTSEGCSSCPPADQFVRDLRGGGLTPDQAVVMSLHVDYWNYIGWKDPYSRAVFTERQRWLSDLAGSRTIYTPEMFVGGQEQRSGWDSAIPDAIRRISAQPAQADIHIALGQAGAGGLPVEVKANAAPGATLYVALVENGIASQVNAGENRGRLLHHDYVVREWLPPVTLAADAKGARGAVATLTRTVMLPPGAQTKNLGVSAFVQSGRGEVLQALALPICGGP